MEVVSIPPVGDGSGGGAQSHQAAGHSFSLSVQQAIGPKDLTGYGAKGQVIVSFSLGNDGALAGLRIARSSGNQRLDLAAMQIMSGVTFPVPPPGMNILKRNYISAFSFS